MKLSSSILVLALALSTSSGLIADPAEVDYSRSNERFAPSPSLQPKVLPAARGPRIDPLRRQSRTMNARAEPASSSARKSDSTAAGAFARISPDVQTRRASSAAERRASSPRALRRASAEVRTFGFVEKYQRRLGSTGAVHIGRTPLPDRDGTARLNRFVFRRTAPSAQSPARDAVRAGSDSSVLR